MDEAKRLEALARYNILDTEPEQIFDDICRLAADLTGQPYAAISLIDRDRVWYKSAVGFPGEQIDRCDSICQTLIETRQHLWVADLTQDPRFQMNRFVTSGPGVRVYVASPLMTFDGYVLGSLAVSGPDREAAA